MSVGATAMGRAGASWAPKRYPILIKFTHQNHVWTSYFLFQGAKDSVGVAQTSETQQLPPTYSAAIDQHKPPSYTPPKAAAAADAEKAATSSSEK